MGLFSDVSPVLQELQAASAPPARTPIPNNGGWGPSIDINDPNSPYYGFAALPDYNPSFTPNMLNMSGLNKFREEALRTGPSQWDRLAKLSSAGKQANEQENALKQSQAQTAASMDDLAARGGLSSGARERTQQSGQKNYLAMTQDLNRQGNLNDLQLDVNDEQNRMSQLGQLPGMELQSVQPMVQENDKRNEYNKWKTDTQNQAIANQKQAQATQNSGKK